MKKVTKFLELPTKIGSITGIMFHMQRFYADICCVCKIKVVPLQPKNQINRK
jgi:hypothetical protein